MGAKMIAPTPQTMQAARAFTTLDALRPRPGRDPKKHATVRSIHSFLVYNIIWTARVFVIDTTISPSSALERVPDPHRAGRAHEIGHR